MSKLKMNTMGLNRYTGKAGLAALIVAASMTIASSPVLAAPTCFTTPIPVPVTVSGIYVNLFTGVAAATTAGAPGWDFNPWGTGNLYFYVAATTPLTGFVNDGTGLVANLSNGDVVGPASTFLTGNATTTSIAPWRAGITNGNLGFRFVESASTYYAWMSVTSVGPLGLPATINNWCFDNTPNTAIPVGTTPVSLQSYSID